MRDAFQVVDAVNSIMTVRDNEECIQCHNN